MRSTTPWILFPVGGARALSSYPIPAPPSPPCPQHSQKPQETETVMRILPVGSSKDVPETFP
jgi:hypothetical protein